MKVALVHDYLKEYGGAERVLEALHEIFPQAPVYTAYFDPSGLGSHGEEMKKWDIRTSWIQKLPWAGKLISPLRILAPAAFESFNLKDYDLVISSCNIYFSKAVITGPKSLHISYIHTPPRYLYGFNTSFNYKKHWWTRLGGELINHILRLWDYQISQRPDVLVANSKVVAERIKKFYRRDSVLIYPPVEVENIKDKQSLRPSLKQSLLPQDLQISKIKTQEKKYFLSVGRLVKGKGIEIIVEACTKLDLPLKVVGLGPELELLQKIAGKNVEFLGHVEDHDLISLYAQAKATIVASEEEDFGIVPVESMAAGTPVIAPSAGGFLETVIEGKTGILFDPLNVESLIAVLEKFDATQFKGDDCINQAEKFGKERFKKEILTLVEDKLKG